MTILINHNNLTGYTIQHLLGWIESLGNLIDTEDWPFDTCEEVAMQLEKWRAEFQAANGKGIIAHEEVTVTTYGEEVILIKQDSIGEYIQLTLTNQPCIKNQETY